MSNKQDSVFIRANYRTRLDMIRNDITKAIAAFDKEYAKANERPKK